MSCPAINTEVRLHLLPTLPEGDSDKAGRLEFFRGSQLPLVPEDDPSYIFRGRLLRIGEVAGLFSPTSIGKSTLVVQCATGWACGEAALGIQPLRPLRVMIVQTENDEAEMAIQINGARTAFPSIGCESLLDDNLLLARPGGPMEITDCLDQCREEHCPDLIVLDPLQGLSPGVAYEPKTMARVMREIEAWARENEVAVLVVHHTPKPARTPGGRLVSPDPIYGATGGAEFANVARVLFSIEKASPEGRYFLRIGKRESRSPWRDANGQRVPFVPIERCGSPDAPRWQISEWELIATTHPPAIPRADRALQVLRELIQERGDWEQNALHAAAHARGVSRASCTGALREMLERGEVRRDLRSRSGSRPAIHWILEAAVVE